MTNSHVSLKFILFFLLCASLVLAENNFRIDVKNEHFKNRKNCQTCHLNKSENLQLLTGEKIDRNDIPKLCGQCHGIVKRDFDKNIHGKKSKSWQNIKSQSLSCIECHDPHSPSLKKMKAQSPPKKPKLLIPKKHNFENQVPQGENDEYK